MKKIQPRYKGFLDESLPSNRRKQERERGWVGKGKKGRCEKRRGVNGVREEDRVIIRRKGRKAMSREENKPMLPWAAHSYNGINYLVQKERPHMTWTPPTCPPFQWSQHWGSRFQHSNFEGPIKTTAGCSSSQESSYWNTVMGVLFKVFVGLAWGYPPKEQVRDQEAAQAKICSKVGASGSTFLVKEFYQRTWLLAFRLSPDGSSFF